MAVPMSRAAMHEGRASRGQFWRVMALAWGLGLAWLAADHVLFDEEGGGLREFLLIVVGLMVFLPAITVTVRRLHDLDYSGWFVLLTFIPYLGVIVAIVIGCLPGTKGTNRFGADPLGHEPVVTPEAEQVAPSAPPPATSPTSASFASRDVIAEIERLAQLKSSGALTETEFEAMKARTLGRGAA